MDVDKLIPGNIQELQPYVAGKTIDEVAKEYNIQRISKLASNENRIGCSEKVTTAVLNALENIQDYPDPVARDLKRAISQKTGVSESEIIIAAGSESIISIICRTFFEDQDHAITADATFVGFFVQAGVRGVPVIKVPVTDSYKFDVDQILSRINERTKLVYIANPNNPTGTYINKTEYEKLLNGIPDHVLLIADEAYYEYAREIPDYPPALSYRKDNVIVLRTFSKAFGLAGLRIGYAIAHRTLISQMMKTKLTFEPTTTAQAAALAAYQDEEFIQKSVDLVNQERRELYDFFDKFNVQYVKSISNSVLMILDSIDEAVDFTQKMLEQGVILRRVNAFGLPNCVRITIGTEQEMAHFRESFKAIR